MSSRHAYLGRLAQQVRTMTRPACPAGFLPETTTQSHCHYLSEAATWAEIRDQEARIERTRAEFRARYYASTRRHTRQSGHSVNQPPIGVFSPRRSRRRLV